MKIDFDPNGNKLLISRNYLVILALQYRITVDYIIKNKALLVTKMF